MKKIENGPGQDNKTLLIRESEAGGELYQAFYHNAPLSFQSLDPSGRIIDVNQKWCKVLGYNQNEVLGKWFGDFLRYDYVELFKSRFEGFKSRGSVDNAGFFIRRKDGCYIEIDLSGTIAYDKEGEVVQTFCVFSDVTRQKEIEGELAKSARMIDEIGKVARTTEKKYRYYLELSPTPIFIANSNAEYTYVNSAASVLTGYSKSELLKMRIPDLHFGEYSEAVKEDFKTLSEGEQLVDYQTVIKTKDNKKRSVLVNTVQLPDEEYIAFVTDISNIANAELALSEREATIAGIFKVAPLGIWLSVNREFVHVNSAICRILGYEPDEILGYNSFMIYPNIEEYDRVGKLIDEQFESGIQNEIETVFVTKSGDPRNMQVNIIPLDPNNREKGFVFTALDITEKKETEVNLIKAKEKAEESDRLKSAFLQNMSHEIRTPMNGIVGFIELLRIGGDNDPMREEYFNTISNCSNQLINIVNDILDISKIETGQIKLDISRVNIGSVLSELNKRFSPLAKGSGLNFSIEASENLDSLFIDTDGEKFKRVLSNLISNALKFTDKGSVTIVSKLSSNLLTIAVSDTGIGITDEDKEQVFKRFRQADDTIARKRGGAGLGLAISKGLTELLGGSINFESELGKGSTFTLTLPYIDDKSIIERVVSVPGKTNCDTTILVVEDGEFNRYYLRELLSKHNYNILFTERGEDAIALCKSTPEIDVVLMDIKLPGIDGLEATKVIKEHRPDLIVIAQTAYAMASDRLEAVAAGCDNYIAKPIDAEILLGMLKRYY